MNLAALSVVRHRLQVGTPLPFNVRAADRTLLLARGQQVADEAQLRVARQTLETREEGFRLLKRVPRLNQPRMRHSQRNRQERMRGKPERKKPPRSPAKFLSRKVDRLIAPKA